MTTSARVDPTVTDMTLAESEQNGAWWKTARAKSTGLVSLAFAIVMILIWRFAFYPYVSTDDARVAMTVIRIAPAGIGGRIVKVNATEGARVKQGDVLVEIDHRIPQAEVDRTRAKTALAEKELKRIQRLFAQNTATAQSLDMASANYEAALAEFKKAEVALENTYLKSSLNGIVIHKSGEIGNILDPGQTALTVADADNAWVSANIEETSVKGVKVGQPVEISVDEGGTLSGKVAEIRAATAAQFALIPSDNAAGNFTKVVQRIPIKIIILENDQKPTLRAGQSVEIKIRIH